MSQRIKPLRLNQKETEMKNPSNWKLTCMLILMASLSATLFAQKRSSDSEVWKKGDKVEVQDGNAWQVATIMDIKNLKYLIHFETQTKADIWVMSNRIRTASKQALENAKKFKEEKAAAVNDNKTDNAAAVNDNKADNTGTSGAGKSESAGASAGGKKADNTAKVSGKKTDHTVKAGAKSDNSENLLVIDLNLPLNMSGTYKVGDRVQVWHNGNGQFTWMESRILEINDGKYKIYYGGSRYNVATFDESKIRNEAREKAQAERGQYFKDVKKFRTVLGEYTPDYYIWDNGNVTDDQKIDALKKAMPQIDELDKLMKEKYADMKDPTENVSDPSLLPSHLRDVVSRKAGTLSQIMAKITSGKLGGKLKSIKEDIAKVDALPGNGKGIWHLTGEGNTADTYDIVFNNGQKTLMELKTYVDKFNQAAGLSGDGGIVAEYQKALADAKTAFFANLPASTFDIPYHDATIEGVCRKFLQDQIPGAVILKSGVEEANWRFEKTESGIILARLKWAAIQWKDPKTGQCCFSTFLYDEDALVNGTFQKPGYITSNYGYVFGWAYQKCN
jgi:hypothetical protein